MLQALCWSFGELELKIGKPGLSCAKLRPAFINCSREKLSRVGVIKLTITKKGPDTRFFETAGLPLKLIPATQLCLISAILDFLYVEILKVAHIFQF